MNAWKGRNNLPSKVKGSKKGHDMQSLVRLSAEVQAYLARGGEIKTVKPMTGTSHAKLNDMAAQYFEEGEMSFKGLDPSRVSRGRKTLRGASQKRKWTADVVGKMKAKIERKDLLQKVRSGSVPVSQGLGLDGNNCC